MTLNSRLEGHPKLQYLLAYSVFSILTVVTMLAVFTSAVTWVYAFSLPSPDTLTHRDIPQSTEIFDRNGKLLYEVYNDENRTLIPLKNVPQVMINATLAAEDAGFYHHDGVDVKGMAVAAYQTVVNGKLQGGSTITQQLVKKALLNDDRRTVDRKIKEIILSFQLERRYTKDQILQMYLNEVPYGGQVYGIEAASKTYFGKDVKDLTLPEAALIAGLTQSPTDYSPFEHRQASIDRQRYVLHLMQKEGMITAAQEEQARNQTLAFASTKSTIKAPWFTLWVKGLLEQQYGTHMVEEGGLRVTTSLDLDKQEVAEQEVNYQMDRLAQSNANASQGALLSMDPKTGEILAMVGSRNYFDSAHDGNVNGTLAERQPGSAIKPLVYLTGFMSHKITPATLLNDSRTVFNAGIGQPPYIPQESDGKYWGPIMAHDALANSRNIPTVQVMQKIGLDSMLTTAKEAGITTYTDPSRFGLSLALGGGEVRMLDLAEAYSTLANNGVQQDPVAILKVETSDGRVLSQYQPGPGKSQFDARYAYQITNILSDNQARQRLFGPGNLLELDRPAAVKTGTTNDNRDAWTAGYTPDLVTLVWVGNFDNTPMNGIMGATGATPIWHYYMERVLNGVPAQPFTRPDGLVDVPVTAKGELSCSPATTVRVELFVQGTQPTTPCNFQFDGGDQHFVAGEQIDRSSIANDIAKQQREIMKQIEKQMQSGGQ